MEPLRDKLSRQPDRPKNPGGRPSKYKKKYCKDLVEHMTMGFSFESFAGVVGVSRGTVYQWALDHPEFSDAKERGVAASLLFWEQMGRAGSAGMMKGFNAFSWTINMRCRFGGTGWNDKNPQLAGADGGGGGRVIRMSYPDPKQQELPSAKVVDAEIVEDKNERGTAGRRGEPGGTGGTGGGDGRTGGNAGGVTHPELRESAESAESLQWWEEG